MLRALNLSPIQSRITLALEKVNRIMNQVTEYNIILDKKKEIFNQEHLLLEAKQAFTNQKYLIEQKEQQILDTRKDFELQKELNNIEMMSRIYAKQLSLQSELSQSRLQLDKKWSDFESRQFEYFNLTRQLMQEENIYIYKVRRLGLFYNWVFISVHLLIFCMVQWNERRKRQEILMEIAELKNELVAESDKAVADGIESPSEQMVGELESNPLQYPRCINFEPQVHFWQGLAVGCMGSTFLYVIQSIMK